MLRHTILALATVAVIGGAGLAPTTASAEYYGNYRGDLRHDRADLRRDLYDLRRDRREIGRDLADIRHDRRDFWRDRYHWFRWRHWFWDRDRD